MCLTYLLKCLGFTSSDSDTPEGPTIIDSSSQVSVWSLDESRYSTNYCPSWSLPKGQSAAKIIKFDEYLAVDEDEDGSEPGHDSESSTFSQLLS